MSIYERYLLPHMINCACGSSPIRYLRKQIVPRCYGDVLEIGMGSGLNLPYYKEDKVNLIWGLEPSLGMRKKATKNLTKTKIKVQWLDLPSEEIPLNSNSVDSILLTFCLCTIQSTQLALAEMHRVLKPDGKLFLLSTALAMKRILPAGKTVLHLVGKEYPEVAT